MANKVNQSWSCGKPNDKWSKLSETVVFLYIYGIESQNSRLGASNATFCGPLSSTFAWFHWLPGFFNTEVALKRGTFGCQFCYVQKPGDPCGLWWPVVLLSDVQILGYFRTYSSSSIELVHWRASCRYPFAPCSCSCCNGLFLHYGGLWVECPMQPLNDGELYAQLSTIPSIVFCWFDMFDFGCAWPGLNLIREG